MQAAQREALIGIRERVQHFIVENFYLSDGAGLADETSLIESGIVDSTGVLELIAFLESEFGISMADTDVTPENLETVGRIARFVAGR